MLIATLSCLVVVMKILAKLAKLARRYINLKSKDVFMHKMMRTWRTLPRFRAVCVVSAHLRITKFEEINRSAGRCSWGLNWSSFFPGVVQPTGGPAAPRFSSSRPYSEIKQHCQPANHGDVHAHSHLILPCRRNENPGETGQIG